MRCSRLFITSCLGAVSLLAVATPAAADRTSLNPSLEEQLAAASKGYLDAKAKLEHSQKRQKELSTQVKTVEVDLVARDAAVAALASEAYRVGPLASMSALLGSPSPDALLDRVSLLDAVAASEEKQVRHAHRDPRESAPEEGGDRRGGGRAA